MRGTAKTGFPARVRHGRASRVLAALLAALTAFPTAALADMPRGCAGGACGRSGGDIPFSQSGTASYTQTSRQEQSGATYYDGLVSQIRTKETINWESYNLGRGNTMTYRLVDANGEVPLGAVFQTFNVIHQNDKSVIEGAIKVQPGQSADLIFYNQNGILFKGGAEVNARSLIFTALNLDWFNDPAGVFSKIDPNGNVKPAFVWEGDAAGFADSLIQVDPGAKLGSQLGGAVMLFAPKVINQGQISSPEGQVVMAAGGKVYLTAPPRGTYPADSPLNGLAGVLVEVDPFVVKDANGITVSSQSGEVTNDTLGKIIAERGNVTLAALAVNQRGRITATTSVNNKGSIRLLAREGNATETVNGVQGVLSATTTGALTFGAGSVTEVLPDMDSRDTLPDGQTFNVSTIQGIGKTVVLQDGAQVRAPGGHIGLSAQILGNAVNEPTYSANDSRIYLGRGSVIDAAGTAASTFGYWNEAMEAFGMGSAKAGTAEDRRLGVSEILVPMERNFAEVLLTANELKDNPLNRAGYLYRKKVWVDVRDLPDPGLMDVAGLVPVARTAAEKLAAGGTVKLRSEGDIIQRERSRIDVSGGAIRYLDGAGYTSQLVSDGNTYDIGSAPADRGYDGIVGQYTRYNAETKEMEVFYAAPAVRAYQGYTEGKDAGGIYLNAHALVLNGELRGQVTRGQHQRGADGPKAATLVLGDYFRLPDVRFTAGLPHLAAGFGAASALPDAFRNTTHIASAMLRDSGIRDIAVYADGRITVEDGASLVLPTFGKLNLTGTRVEVYDDLIAHAGDISLVARRPPGATPYFSDVVVGGGADISTAGLWVNDALTGPDLAQPLAGIERNARDGGSIAIKAYGGIEVGEGSLLDVSGSAYVDGKRKTLLGNAGSIALETNVGQPAGAYETNALDFRGDLRAFAPGKGGSLTLSVPALTLGNTARGVDGELLLTPDFFNRYGFAKFTLTGRDGVLVRSGATIEPTVATYTLSGSHQNEASGADIARFATLGQLPEHQRQAVSLTLNATNRAATPGLGWLKVEQGATLRAGLRGALNLSATRGLLEVDGILSAKGGSIALTMEGTPGDPDVDQLLGYDPTQAIWIGKTARLDASGAVLMEPSVDGLQRGRVLDAGTISLNAKKGYIVAEEGAQLDVSAASVTLDRVAQYGTRQLVESYALPGNAGTINIAAREGALLDATLNGQSAGARAGALNLSLTHTTAEGYPGTSAKEPDREWKAVLRQSGGVVPASLIRGASIDAVAPGEMHFALDRLQQGGFESLSAKADHAVRFAGDASLALNRSIQIDAPRLESDGGKVTLDAAYVMLGNQRTDKQTMQVPVAGAGELTVKARHVDLVGNLALHGFGKANIASDGDVRLRGVVVNNSPVQPEGSFAVAGPLTIDAQQIYPATGTRFLLSAPGSTITFGKKPNAPAPVYSAGGELIAYAKSIIHGGVLKAPFGAIELAADEVTLKPGSVTSVSGDGLTIPYGQTQLGGREWVYRLNNEYLSVIDAPPEKVIRFSAADIDMQEDASGRKPEIDVRGGGDLLAWEWSAGTGGSQDVLSAAAAQGMFAVLPDYSGAIAPFDNEIALEYANSGLKPGDSVYLSGGGLAGKHYTLLPARYALLPGAWLVKPVSGYQDMLPGTSIGQNDGTSIVSGNFASADRGASYTQTSRTGGFWVAKNDWAFQRSEYALASANGFFANVEAGAQLPGDAGRLVIDAKNSLALAANFRTDHAAGYRGALADITAPKLAVVSSAADSVPDGYVKLLADTLTALKAESLLLGGTRSMTNDGIAVDVGSGDVLIANSSDHALSGSEIMLAATDSITLQSGAKVAGTGGAGARQPGAIHIGSADQGVDGDGAFLRVSAAGQADLLRENTDGNRGDLTVNGGAVVSGSGSMLLDATRDLQVPISALKPNGEGELALSANRFSLGQTDKVKAGLVLSNDDFSALLANVRGLKLSSYSTFDIYGKLDMKAMLQDIRKVNPDKATPNLALDGAGIAGYAYSYTTTDGVVKNVAGDATLVADTLRLSNAKGAAFSAAPNLTTGAAPTLGSAKLTIEARELRTGDGTFTLKGFSDSTIKASDQVVAGGVGTLKAEGHALTIDTPRVTAGRKANFGFESDAALRIVNAAPKADYLTAPVPDARLGFTGASVEVASLIDLPGGRVDLTALSGDVTVKNNGEVRVAGVEVPIFDQKIAMPAGTIRIVAKGGKADIQSGGKLDLSAQGGDAGTLEVEATEFIANGDLDGKANKDASGKRGRGGRFDLTADSISADGLGGKLSAGGFDESIRLRAKTGDLSLSKGLTMSAREIQWVADNGAITVAGTLDASGDKGGSIVLAAKGDANLAGTGTLKATGEAGRGGRVEMASADGYLDLDDKSTIDVSGATAGGQVWLRAKASGTGVQVRDLKAKVVGTEYADPSGTTRQNAYLEAVVKKSYNAANQSIGSTEIDAYKTLVSEFMKNASVSALSGTPFRLVPGLEIENPGGGLTLSADWDFATKTGTAFNWRYGANGEAGVLTLRAKGDIQFDKSLSDGFTTTFDSKTKKLLPLADWSYGTSSNFVDSNFNSWSYRVVAGADTESPLATRTVDSQGKLIFTTPAASTETPMLRTGTGSIDLASGGDIDLNAPWVIYTAGTKGPSVSGFYTPGCSSLTSCKTTDENFKKQLAWYPTLGGDIRIAARGDIAGTAPVLDAANPMINQWLWRQRSSSSYANPQTTWWPRFDKFRQGVATLGGGDITVVAGGDISDLWLSAPTNARLGGSRTVAPDLANLKVQGGGDIDVRAGGNVGGDSLIFVARGTGEVLAQGDIDARVALQDGVVSLAALGNATVKQVVNPTALPQSNDNYTNSTSKAIYFNTYSPRAGIGVMSWGGNARASIASINQNNTAVGTRISYVGTPAYAANLAMLAPLGGIQVGPAEGFPLFPDARGNLTLLAGRDVRIDAKLIMSDYAVDTLPGIATPANNESKLLSIYEFSLIRAHDAGLQHLGDTEPVRVYSGKGDIEFKKAALLVTAKRAEIRAGNDIVAPNLSIQHLDAGDVSVISAGHDLSYTPKRDPNTLLPAADTSKIEIGGPGRLEAMAGHSIDLGSSDGLVSIGNFNNPALPSDQAATLAVLAGLGKGPDGGARAPDYAAFAVRYLAPGSAALRDLYAFFAVQAGKDIRARVKQENPGRGDAAIDALLQTAPYQARIDARRANLIDAFEHAPLSARAMRVFYNELRLAGIEWTQSESRTPADAQRGYDAAATLFPASINGQPVQYDGNLDMYFSQIKSQRGADIELALPGGSVNAGLASGGINKKASDLGITTVRGGDIRGYVRQDFLVNTSRVFTLGGGDIILWSDFGDIDAGKGERDATAAPPPEIRIELGKLVYDTSGSVSGSGIGVLVTRDDVPVGDTYLTAPNGEVNAGEAGIRSAGNLFIAASRVVGADLIQTGGTASGVPAADTSGLGGALSSFNPNDASKATEEATRALGSNAGQSEKALQDARAALAGFRPSFITVEAVGVGPEGTSLDEAERKRREAEQGGRKG